MADSKKNSDDESIFDKVVSSINKIDEFDNENKSDEEKKEVNNEKKEKNSDDELFLTSKTDEILSNDFKRKFPFLAIIGIVLGIIIILAGIFLILGASERVVDSVASGETGTLAIFVIFLGIVILGASSLVILSKNSPISDKLDNLEDLKLLDEDEDSKRKNNSKNKDSDETVDKSKGEYADLDNETKKTSKLNNSDDFKKFKELDEDGNEISSNDGENNDKKYDILDIDGELSNSTHAKSDSHDDEGSKEHLIQDTNDINLTDGKIISKEDSNEISSNNTSLNVDSDNDIKNKEHKKENSDE